MSIKLMSLVWELSQVNSEINRDDKFLLLALADHANDDGECYPSLSKILNVFIIYLYIIFLFNNFFVLL